MASGSRRGGAGEYVFVDGRAVRADEAMGAPVQETFVPGREQDALVPGAAQAGSAGRARGLGRGRSGAGAASSNPTDAARQAAPGESAAGGGSGRSSSRRALRQMDADDAFAMRDGVAAGQGYVMGGESLVADDRRKMRRLYLIFGLVLLVCFFVSCCADMARIEFRSPVEVVQGLATWVSIQFASLFHPQDVADMRVAAAAAGIEYADIAFQLGQTLKYGICGVMLAISGMLYQNAFRNPIAAPSMLGVTNGVTFAILVLVMMFGYTAYEHLGLYYLFAYVGGALVLALVMLGGKWVSGKRKFNVVNMILIGTIVSQLLGVVITYVENNFMTDMDWEAYTRLVNASGITNTWTYVSLIVGAIVSLLPVFAFRFRLNLVSFSDEETKFLGVNPERLRLLALSCGSIMILTAQVNAGQVAMMSLVIPFVVRAVFGSEFRKQLGGNILVGAILLIVCGVLSNMIIINDMQAGLGAISTLIALPLFVWMIAIRQRSWD